MNIETIGTGSVTFWDDCFPLTEDALALGGFATVRKGQTVCDLGAGSGILSILLSQREPSITMTAVEYDEKSAELCKENFVGNGLKGQVIHGDFCEKSLLPLGGFQLVVSNPPYYSLANGASGGVARSEETCNLDELCSAAGRLVKQGGRFAVCYNPQRLIALISALKTYGLEPKRLQFCHHSTEKDAFCVLVEAVKLGRPSLCVLPPLLR